MNMSKVLWSNRKPTAEELAAQQQAEQEAALAARDQALRAALAEEADPLFFKWQRGEGTESDWLARIAEVKARFPAPAPASGR
jgi:hypothetical protein